jgi:flagellar L-ring protein precursor FlgH
MSIRPLQHLVLLAVLASALAGCSAADRLASVGKAPSLTAIDDPTATPGYKPVSLPMPSAEPPVYRANSLWRSGARGFFKDQRAMRVGDILTVKVRITDSANINNQTARSRKNSEDMGVASMFGFEGNLVPDGTDPAGAVKADSSASSQGVGSVRRSEALTTNVGAIITQILPNGNMVVEGRQEVRVNFEMRELIVAGIVRPEDVESDNTIESTKIAQARISYGGRGQITDVQQPRYGQQVLDVLLPF